MYIPLFANIANRPTEVGLIGVGMGVALSIITVATTVAILVQKRNTRAEAEKPKETAGASTVKELNPNIAGLLCYLVGWITGIIFLILENKNQFVRFHAVQSIVTFGALTIIQFIFRFIPYPAGSILDWIVLAIIIILWVVFMYKAYQGQRYKLPLAGDIAEKLLKSTGKQQ